ncbi:MAG: diguanylate cyclase [Myxococcota bacterium]
MATASDDQVLDTLAGVLRDFGRFSFDLERQDGRRTQAVFDQWAQHLLTGVPAPGLQRASGARNYAELRAQFAAQRRQEQSEFTQSQDALRDVVWMFINSLNREVAVDRSEDGKLDKTLAGVTETLQSAPPADLRRLALEAIKQVQGALAARRERQEKQLAALSSRLEAMGSQLEVARRESNTDGLTQLFNRKAFDEQLDRAVQLATFRGGGSSLLIIDIDHFKKINDTYGHPGGDAVLKAVASACVRVFKRKNDFVARYGGEELVALVSDLSHAEALALGGRLREAIAALRVPWDDQQVQVTASVGVATWERGELPSQWLARADAALYRAKHAGRNRVEG